MEYYVELKLRKDAHNGGFSNGLTLCGGESTRGLERILKKDDRIVKGKDRKRIWGYRL